MTTDTQQRLKEIKQSFRLMMDGATAQSMRNKGLDYHLNWGASQAMLRDKADEIGKDHDLAIALWKEDVRECKILATMVMPADTMEEDLSLRMDCFRRTLPTVVRLPCPLAPVYERTGTE